MLVVNIVQNQTGPRKPLRVLLDSGSDKTMSSQRALPVGATPELLPCTQVANTLAGNLESKRRTWLEDLVFPEFERQRESSNRML